MVDLDLIDFNEWLSSYINFERKPETKMFRLDTMEKLCEALGHPEKSCPCFHVAGSKGKGTISADIAGILREAGYTTGVLASPHVSHFVERVGTGNKPFSQAIYDQAFSELKNVIEKLIKNGELDKELVSWFELTTAFAMLCFRAAKVDYAVYEVGMGGRLDATNIITPKACAFGPIELEHTKILGNTLTKIATEKAGIIKDGVPCVSVAQDPEVAKVFRKIAAEHDAKLEFIGKEGNYLEQDALVAKLVVQKVLPEISDEICERGVSKVSLPGRFEKISGVMGIPYILIDVAHTENSIRQVVDRMRKGNISGKLLFGCAEDKNVRGMAREILNSGIFSEIYLTKPGDFKRSNLNKMSAAFANQNIPVVADHDYKKFIQKVLHKASEDKTPLVVLGSFYLAGEVKKALAENY